MKPYYEHNGITIYHGDCLDVLPSLSAVDAVITDPPYGTTACAWDTVIPFDPMWRELKRLIKPRGAIVLFGSQPFTSALVMSNLEWFKYEWVWTKNRPSDKFNAKNKPLKAHENICVFSNGTTANGSASKMNYHPQGLLPSGKRVRGATGQRHHGLRPSWKELYTLEFTGYPDSVLPFAKNDVATVHPTQKPIALMQYLIKTYTNEDDMVLDFTCGSGTTLLAAKQLRRRAIGIEIDERYCEIAAQRLSQEVFDFSEVAS